MRNYSMGPGISTTEVIWEGEHETTIPGTIRRGTLSQNNYDSLSLFHIRISCFHQLSSVAVGFH